jgi:hypothetical protein
METSRKQFGVWVDELVAQENTQALGDDDDDVRDHAEAKGNAKGNENENEKGK